MCLSWKQTHIHYTHSIFTIEKQIYRYIDILPAWMSVHHMLIWFLVSNTLELEYRQLWVSLWVLRIKLMCPERATVFLTAEPSLQPHQNTTVILPFSLLQNMGAVLCSSFLGTTIMFFNFITVKTLERKKRCRWWWARARWQFFETETGDPGFHRDAAQCQYGPGLTLLYIVYLFAKQTVCFKPLLHISFGVLIAWCFSTEMTSWPNTTLVTTSLHYFLSPELVKCYFEVPLKTTLTLWVEKPSRD